MVGASDGIPEPKHVGLRTKLRAQAWDEFGRFAQKRVEFINYWSGLTRPRLYPMLLYGLVSMFVRGGAQKVLGSYARIPVHERVAITLSWKQLYRTARLRVCEH